MRFEKQELLQEVLKARGFLELNPVQEKAINHTSLLNGKNLVVCAPTASGKTLIAEIASLNTIKNQDAKAVYVGPLRALAREQFDTFKEHYEGKGVKVSLTTGDVDSSEPWLQGSDLIVTTYEKLQSLIIHKAPWLKDVKLLIVDEIHTLDSDRGPALEVTISRLKKTNPGLQILALSATVPNYEDIAKWLEAETVYSEWRPVKLSKGVHWENGIKFDNKDPQLLVTEKDALQAIIKNTLEQEKQALVFRNTKKNAQASAKALRKTVYQTLTEQERVELKKLASQAAKALDNPTSQCKELHECISFGTAFHTAGLTEKQRKIVEQGFKKKLIKIISCTPTLAAGINMPADVVIVKDTQRYTSNGMQPISTSEVLQMFGRAGRPPYNNQGDAICIANTEHHYEYIWDKYVNGEPEPVYSRLGIEPILRTQVLNCIASGFTLTKNALNSFLGETLYSLQFQNTGELQIIVNKVIEDLERMNFVTIAGENLIPTSLGVRVSELSLDPESAHQLIQNLKKMEEQGPKELGVLYSFAELNEMRPHLSVPRTKEVETWEKASIHADDLYDDPITMSYTDYKAMNKFRLALLLKDWVHEKKEDDLMIEYNVAPGILHGMLNNLDWLAYSGSELAKITKLSHARNYALRMRQRVKYGVLEELLPLIVIKGIGRKRARLLYDAGFKNAGEVKRAGPEKLKTILGEKLSEKIAKETEKENLK